MELQSALDDVVKDINTLTNLQKYHSKTTSITLFAAHDKAQQIKTAIDLLNNIKEALNVSCTTTNNRKCRI
jgi:hypothetical protein